MLFFLIPSPALKNPPPALTVPFPDKFFVNRSPSKLAPNVPSHILKNPPFCSFLSFLIVLVTPFNKIFESSPLKLEQFSLCHLFRHSTKVVVPETYIFF